MVARGAFVDESPSYVIAHALAAMCAALYHEIHPIPTIGKTHFFPARHCMCSQHQGLESDRNLGGMKGGGRK